MPIGHRWTQFEFPSYSYVSGCFPHPLRESNGHGCPGPQPPDPITAETSWQDCQLYLWAIDLYHAGFYWEAHEAWEGVWHAAGRRGELADFQKGLIKLAAAGVKAREGRVDGIRRHAARAETLFTTVENRIRRMDLWGMSLPDLQHISRQIATAAEDIAQQAVDAKQIPVLPELPLPPPIRSG